MFFFAKFKDSYPSVPNGRPLQPAPPEPDVLISDAGIGVEITEFYTEEMLKKIESEQDLVLERARAMCEEMRFPPMIIRVIWNAGASTSRKERPILARQLVNAVTKNIPAVNSPVYLEQDGELDSCLPAVVDSIGIERWSEHNIHHWFSPRFSFVSGLSAQQIQKRITEKNARFCHRGACKSLWLLIVAEGIGPSSWCELPEGTKLHEYDSVFDQVFFFHRLYGQVTRLRTRQRLRY